MITSDDGEVRAAALRFLAAFETVFHDDWGYTKAQLGIDDAAQQVARANLLGIFGEAPQPPPDPRASFLDPRRPLDGENWGNYERLLEAYAEMKRLLHPRK